MQANRKNAFPQMDLIPVNGFNVEVVVYGMENNQEGKPVIVFENCRGTDFEYWQPVIQEVSKGHTAFAYSCLMST